MRSRTRFCDAISRLIIAGCAFVVFFALASVRVLAQAATTAGSTMTLVGPGHPGLSPLRVLEHLDTLSLLVTPPNALERSYATLERRVLRMSVGGVPVLREAQHYQFANGTILDDTLDVRAATLEPLRYFSADHSGSFDVMIRGTRILGWRTDSIGARTDVDATATHAFFVSIMSEGFVAALPLGTDATINIPVADPPLPAVHVVTLRVIGIDTLQTAAGAVQCIRIAGPGTTETWIARDDHRLIRMHWTLPDGTSVWKLPVRDAPMRWVRGNSAPA
jgi:hypothetical protein